MNKDHLGFENFLFLFYSYTAGVDQQQNVLMLMKILKYGGFFRDKSGLNNLPSIRELKQILNLKDDFTFELVDDQIESFCSKSKFFQMRKP